MDAYSWIATIAVIVQAYLLYFFFFEPRLDYKVVKPPNIPSDSKEFLRILQGLADAEFFDRNDVEVLTNGENYYEAELQAISQATKTVNLEAYIFQRGEVSRKFVDALVERAKAGVKIRMVADAIGSFATTRKYFKKLLEAGGQVEFYHPFRLHLLSRFNNRTHRELIIIDGRIGFVGGAGFADHWLISKKGHPRWRDTMFRVEGKAVAKLQCVFAENWLEASGEILIGTDLFPEIQGSGKVHSMVVGSTPSAGRSTRSRMLYQTFIACAKKRIYITTPYFLPDPSLRQELIRAIQERGVDVQIITPGKQSDHLLTRRSSRRLYGELLNSGAKIYEYQPAMIHSKTMIVDDDWSIVGTTNLDQRSFGLNDEVNLVCFDEALVSRNLNDFYLDRAQSSAVSFQEWQRRPVWERVHEWFGWLLERQQ